MSLLRLFQSNINKHGAHYLGIAYLLNFQRVHLSHDESLGHEIGRSPSVLSVVLSENQHNGQKARVNKVIDRT